MFDFAWSEILVIGAVVLVVIGPKDLPKAMRTAGYFMRRARGLAREFQNSVDEMIREAELDDIRRTMRETTKLDLDKHIENTIDPGGEIKAALAAPEEPLMKPAEAEPSKRIEPELPKPVEEPALPPHPAEPPAP